MSKLVLAGVGAALMLASVPSAALATAPANDAFASPTPIAIGQTIQASNLDATAEAHDPQPSDESGPIDVAGVDCTTPGAAPRCDSSVWFDFTPTVTGTYTLDTCDYGTDVDTVLAVYHGPALIGLAPEIADDDGATHDCAGGPGQAGSQVTFVATPQTYHVEVQGYHADSGVFFLRAYAGSSAASPTPDTLIERGSVAGAPVVRTPGAHSGPRRTASFAFSSIPSGATFECSYDGATFSPCTSPVSFDAVAGSSHTFAVRAVIGGVPDPTPARQILTIDRTAPDTMLSAGPTHPTADQTPTWTFSTGARDGGEYLCGIDGALVAGEWSCDLPAALCAGTHTFTAAAVDGAFNVDPSPATDTFVETGGTACTAPDAGTPVAQGDGPTDEIIQTGVDAKGYGGRFVLDYGTSAAYGLSQTRAVSGAPITVPLSFLAPATTYHYRTSITTPLGTATSTDQTFTTAALAGDAPPDVSLTGLTGVGNHAAAATFQFGPSTDVVDFGVFIDTKPATDQSPQIQARNPSTPHAASTTRQLGLIDLEPGTYHVRAFARDRMTDLDVLGPDLTLVVPAPVVRPPLPPGLGPIITPPPAGVGPTLGPAVAAFKLRTSLITVARVRRASASLVVTVRRLPARTAVTIRVSIGARRLTVTRATTKAGTLKITMKLSNRLRAALHAHGVKKVTVSVAAKPSNQAATSVVVHPVVRAR